MIEALAELIDARVTSIEHLRVEALRNGFVSGHRVEFATAAGEVVTEIVYVEGNPPQREREGVVRITDGETTFDAWVYPKDPALPLLPASVFAHSAAVLLSRLSIASEGLTLQIVAYRPGKRAVIRMKTDTQEFYAKVVRPSKIAKIRQRHELWLNAKLPVPPVLGWAPDGLLILGALGGQSAAELACDPESLFESIRELTQRIANVPEEAPARDSLSRRVGWYVSRLVEQEPQLSTLVVEIEKRVVAQLAAADDAGPAASTTIHGDLHLGQLLLEPGTSEVVGLLDIDTGGRGDPADDAATLWAHSQVIAELHAQRGEHNSARASSSFADAVRVNWNRGGDPGFALRSGAIAATHFLGHAISGTIAAPRALDLARNAVNMREL